MKYKYTQEEISAKIFDLLCRTRTTDLGRIFGLTCGNMPWMLSSTMCEGRPWTSKAKSVMKTLQKDVKNIVRAYLGFIRR